MLPEISILGAQGAEPLYTIFPAPQVRTSFEVQSPLRGPCWGWGPGHPHNPIAERNRHRLNGWSGLDVPLLPSSSLTPKDVCIGSRIIVGRGFFWCCHRACSIRRELATIGPG